MQPGAGTAGQAACSLQVTLKQADGAGGWDQPAAEHLPSHL